MRHLAVIALLAVALTACGGGADNAAPAKTVTVAPPTTAQPAATPSKAPGSVKTPAATKVRVPNVVGHNHQAAQNEMQAVGLYMLQEQDATGQGRMLILDRNWQVVRQKPKAGTRVSPETTITLYSKKIGE